MKRGLVIAGAIAASAAGAWFALPLLVDANRFRGVIQSSLEKQLGQPVRLGALRLRLFPLAVSATGVAVDGLVTAGELDVRASLFALFGKSIDLDSIIVRDAVIIVVKNERGVINWSEVGGGTGGGSAVTIQQVRVENARIAYADHAARKPRVEYGPLDLDVRGIASGATPTIDAALTYSGISITLALPPSGPATLRLGDAITLTGPVTLRNGELDATLAGQAEVSKLAPVLRALGAPSIDIENRGALTTSVRYQKGGWTATGDLRDLAFKLAPGAPPITIASAKYTASPAASEIRDVSATLAGSAVRGRLGIRNSTLSFAVDADKLDLTELQKLSGPSTGKSTHPLAGITGSGTLTAAKLISSGLEFENLRADCRVANEQIRLDPFAATLFGGRQAGSIVYNARTDPPEIAVNLQLADVDADRMLSATTSVKKVLAGLLDATGNFAFTAAADPAAIARSLNGAISFKLNKGRLQGVNLFNELAGLGQFLGWSKQSQSVTDVLAMSADLRIAGGVASTDNLRIELDGAGIGASGTMNLADQSLNLKLSALLSKAFSDRAGGKQIGGFLSTAFANERGELVIPAIVSGTFAQPRFTPDAEAVAKSKLKSFIGGDTPQDQMKSILDRFRKKK